MPSSRPKSPAIRGINEVGRYAVRLQWSDGHDSIYPLENLRRFCPCLECRAREPGEIAPEAQRMRQFIRLGEQAVLVGWSDGHETLYTVAQLRAICRCAYCAREPERPITGS